MGTPILVMSAKWNGRPFFHEFDWLKVNSHNIGFHRNVSVSVLPSRPKIEDISTDHHDLYFGRLNLSVITTAMRTSKTGGLWLMETSPLPSVNQPYTLPHMRQWCCNLWHYGNCKQMPTQWNSCYYGNSKVKGVVNNTAVYAQKCVPYAWQQY